MSKIAGMYEVGSLSARRAWIEIVGGAIAAYPVFVALRKESVDRNAYGRINDISRLMSLSARRAWIEIWALGQHGTAAGVALRKESVDRNVIDADFAIFRAVALRKESVDRNPMHRLWKVCRLGRSPQGERG